MAWIHVRHTVADYNKWKEIYDATAELKREYGWRRYRLYMVDGNRNDLLVMEEFTSSQEAQRYLQSDDLRTAMSLGGIVGTPQILLLDGLEEGTA